MTDSSECTLLGKEYMNYRCPHCRKWSVTGWHGGEHFDGGRADTRKDSAASRDTGELSTPTSDLRELAPSDEYHRLLRLFLQRDGLTAEICETVYAMVNEASRCAAEQAYALGRKQGLEEALEVVTTPYSGRSAIEKAIRELMEEEEGK